MSARSSRWRAHSKFERDLLGWKTIASTKAIKLAESGSFDESYLWMRVEHNCTWMLDRICRPNLAPTITRRSVRTVLVPWTVYKRLERQTNAWQNARAKRKAQIRRMKK